MARNVRGFGAAAGGGGWDRCGSLSLPPFGAQKGFRRESSEVASSPLWDTEVNVFWQTWPSSGSEQLSFALGNAVCALMV